MKKSLLVFLLFCVAAVSVPAQQKSGNMLVSTSWLADHVNDKSLVVFHVAFNRRDYTNGHIPGARFLWASWMMTSSPDLSTELPPAQELDTLLEGLGVTNGSRIILYGSGGNVTIVARMYFTLDYLGLADRVSIVDGGFDMWKSEGRPVSKEIPTWTRGKVATHINKNLVATADWINANLNQSNVAIIDARSNQFYNGTGGGQNRAGHIPGAKSIPFSSVVDSTNKMKSKATLLEAFTAAGVKPGAKIIPYCHVGQQATLIYFTAKYLGYEAKLYDGSFEDWSGREDLPVENPSAAAKK